MCKEPINPGSFVYAIKSILLKSIFVFIFSIKIAIFFECSLDAISGIVPPYFLCTSIWLIVFIHKTLLFLHIANDVSSCEDSIENINILTLQFEDQIHI